MLLAMAKGLNELGEEGKDKFSQRGEAGNCQARRDMGRGSENEYLETSFNACDEEDEKIDALT